jgi:ABC-type multidrug transport system ATPase subunit
MRSLTAYEKLVTRLFVRSERYKFEWAIGSAIQSGPMNSIVVFQGPPASGKSTVLNIISMLFGNGAISVIIDGSPAIDVNEHLFMATVKPVDISDVSPEDVKKLFVVKTSGETHSVEEYKQLCDEIVGELLNIAHICSKRFEELGEDYYNDQARRFNIDQENDK